MLLIFEDVWLNSRVILLAIKDLLREGLYFRAQLLHVAASIIVNVLPNFFPYLSSSQNII